MQKGPVTPKGFNDLDQNQAKIKRQIINKIADNLEEYGFLPLETPIVEFAQTLLGKYGEDEKLIYTFEDRGGRKLALRYDLTVPLARYIANNQNLIKNGFSRYQIGQVFRGEKPQKGRSREFTQFDYDIVGPNKVEDDAKIIAAAISSFRNLGYKKAQMAINDRASFTDMTTEDVRLLDKLHKIGINMMNNNVKEYLSNAKPTNRLQEIFNILENKYNFKENEDFFFDPSLARGLDYYTSTVFEMKLTADPADLSVGGGGRYDNLIGMFAGKSIPAVGFSFGVDRLIELSSQN